MDDKMNSINSTLVGLLTAANEEDMGMYTQLLDELWADPNNVDSVLNAALFTILGILDYTTHPENGGVRGYLQAMALFQVRS